MRALRLGVVAALVAWGITAVTGTSQANVVKPFDLGYSGKIYGDFITIGNAVLGCPASTAKCVTAMERKGLGNNNDFDMQYVNPVPDVGAYDSSTSQLTIPAGASIAFAQLHWAGNTGIYMLGKTRLRRCDAGASQNAVLPAGDPLTAAVKLKVGTGAVQEISPSQTVGTPASESGPHYYTAEADIKTELGAAPTGSPVKITVGDLWAPTGYGCIGGWAMTVVYRYPDAGAEPNAHQLRAVYVYDGHVLQRSADPPMSTDISGFHVGAVGAIRAGVTAYEGDYNVPGSRFAVNGTLIANPDNPGAGTNKFFDSYAAGTVDPSYPNNMSVDAKDFVIPKSILPAGSTSAELTFSTKGDTYLAQVIAFSVPVPDIVISKVARPAAVHPGEKIHYTITVTNRGGIEEPHAGITDDLTGVLEDAHYNDDGHAAVGSVSFHHPHLTWKEPLAPGESVTITYSVTVDNAARGDRGLRNVVSGDGVEVSCAEGGGTSCETMTEVKGAPTPPPTPTPTPPPSPTPHPKPKPGPHPRPRPIIVPCRAMLGARGVAAAIAARPSC